MGPVVADSLKSLFSYSHSSYIQLKYIYANCLIIEFPVISLDSYLSIIMNIFVLCT